MWLPSFSHMSITIPAQRGSQPLHIALEFSCRISDTIEDHLAWLSGLLSHSLSSAMSAELKESLGLHIFVCEGEGIGLYLTLL